MIEVSTHLHVKYDGEDNSCDLKNEEQSEQRGTLQTDRHTQTHIRDEPVSAAVTQPFNGHWQL